MVVVNVWESSRKLVLLECFRQLVAVSVVVVVWSPLGRLPVVDPSVSLIYWRVTFVLASLGAFNCFDVCSRCYVLGDLCGELIIDYMQRLKLGLSESPSY